LANSNPDCRFLLDHQPVRVLIDSQAKTALVADTIGSLYCLDVSGTCSGAVSDEKARKPFDQKENHVDA